jgi:single-strand DNA-binding protein
MGDVQMTVSGWVGSDPEFHSGHAPRSDRVTFRLASTPRFFDRAAGGYRDQETVWLKVKAWRDLAHNIAASVHVGEPVVVVGRLRTHTYTVDGETKQYQELEAGSVGHDLTLGTSMFRRTSRAGDAAAAERPGQPAGATALHEQPVPAGEGRVSVLEVEGSVEAPAGAA